MCCKRSHINFSTFSLKFKCKICVQKEVIHNFKNHILVTWPATNLLNLRKWCRFEKLNHYYFDKDMTHSSFFEEKLYNFHFHKNDVTWPLSANGLSITVWLTFWLHRICLHLFKHVELPAGRVECLKWLKLAQFNFFPHSLIRKATLLWGNLQMSSFVHFTIGHVNTITTGPL